KLMAGSNMTRQTRQAAVVQLQRTHGNAFVQRMLNGQSANTLQRLDDFGMESFDWSNTGENTADNTGALNPDMPSGQSESIGGGGSSVSAGGAGVNISGPSVSINSPMTQADGVIRASTIIADSVIASTYSPGTGN